MAQNPAALVQADGLLARDAEDVKALNCRLKRPQGRLKVSPTAALFSSLKFRTGPLEDKLERRSATSVGVGF